MTNIKTNVIQRPQDLVLAILPDGELPAMTVLQQSELYFGDWHFQFSIIGESHHIRVEHAGEAVLNEVLACVSVAQTDCVHYQSFADLAAHDYESGQYQVQVESGHEPRWRIPKHDINQIAYTFPTTFGQQPVTRIQWRRSQNTVHWWTLHTYAEATKTTFVHTASVFHCHAEGNK